MQQAGISRAFLSVPTHAFQIRPPSRLAADGFFQLIAIYLTTSQIISGNLHYNDIIHVHFRPPISHGLSGVTAFPARPLPTPAQSGGITQFSAHILTWKLSSLTRIFQVLRNKNRLLVSMTKSEISPAVLRFKSAAGTNESAAPSSTPVI